MQLVIHTVCYNESKLLPFFLDYYARFATKIVVWDNMSTDSTQAIARSHSAVEIEVNTFDTDGEFRDDVHRQIKNQCWKNQDADWVIVCDADEFLYHDDLMEFLDQQRSFSIFKPVGYDMVSTEFPVEGSLITEQIKFGIPAVGYSKMVLFDPRRVREINYAIGAHHARPLGREPIKIYDARRFGNDLKLLHYKNISFSYRFEKNTMFGQRRGSVAQSEQWGHHLSQDLNTQRDQFDSMLASAVQVVP